ncbi:MAG: Ig-like domain-containing protein, partial [Solirubrobacteraceae bacterium]
PYACAGVDTTTLADGLYDLRAIAEDNAGFITTSSVITVRIDNAAPAVPTVSDPGANLQGSVAFTGTATDSGSGIAAWLVQYRPAGSSGSWIDACSDPSSPYGCSWGTTGAADALYDLRAVARDQAGNETPSATLTNRRVDNNGPTVTLTDPGAYLRGTVALSATASDPAGVASVTFQYKLSSSGTWTTICTDNATPFTCSFNTTGLNGTYDVQALATDTLGKPSTSIASARTIDNTAPTAVSVDSGNGGAIVGRLEPGDWLRLTWSEPIAPASVLAGWDGSPLAIRVELQNINGSDEMDLWNSTGATHLNLVDDVAHLKLNANFVTTNGWFDATLTRSGGVFTITLGTKLSGTLVTATAANISWKPSILATDLAGNPSTALAVAELSPKDIDF